MTKPIKRIQDVRVHVDDFAKYLKNNRAWGIFHVALDDCNWSFDAAEPTTAQERQLVGIFKQLTQSQRSKLEHLAREKVSEQDRASK